MPPSLKEACKNIDIPSLAILRSGEHGPVKSILDNDLYKFTMQMGALELYQHTQVTYEYKDRRGEKWTPEAVEALKAYVRKMADLQLQDYEYRFLKIAAPYLSFTYLEYLRNYRFDPNEVDIKLTDEGYLKITITGLWHRTILWEVPLMATISQTYFEYIDTDWNEDGQEELIDQKGEVLEYEEVPLADFSTRRRRSFHSQDRVIRRLHTRKNFVGTSNVFFAMLYRVKPLGTMAHEWIMAHMVLESLLHCNRHALRAWNRVYKGSLGTALTDTVGSDAFFADFDGELARMFDGVRHDSGDPIEFLQKVIAHYKSLGIDPMTKTIIFSDGLDVTTAVNIKNKCEGGIRCSFGIGTFLSNDYRKASDKTKKSKALNIVIKLRTVNGIEVVKISDTPSKATGDRDALRVANWIIFKKPLDAE